ncbi:MAG: hypothetical protein MI923_00580, partial [Phycisphaerales bacterium]|nr:hypothetical protein [Phycisphaerales bacterium]
MRAVFGGFYGAFRAVWSLGLALALAACLPTAQNPLPTSETEPLDRRLMGAWIGTIEDEEEPVFLHFVETVERKIKAILVTVQTTGEPDGGWAEFDVTSSQLANGRYLNVYWTENDGQSVEELNGFHLMRYTLSDDGVLALYFADAEKLETAIQDGTLAGNVSSSGLSRTIRITASSAELAAFVEAQPPGE